ncbi:MAG: bifunctional phosphoribosyl-AMP cyclohydrolase/phosphoribosyl-ATP diphosphatase HisIE [Clostridia bacterium]|nr:bifunctional phosphoribosyl-AMP cyclohydrolase/phosphoribosyl-ATP diphosphatase HisIE [Clostridia bacterium]
MDLSQVKYNEQGLIPAIAQDAGTGEVLMLAWMNEESLSLTLETGYATYFSRSRGKLWKKGETSGHTQKVLGIRLDCDQDAILLTVEQTGPACHTGARSCFFNEVLTPDEDELPPSPFILERVYRVIEDRKEHPQEGSYTNYLLDKGIEKICKKVGEEASEAIIAAMKNSPEEVTYEAADLLYHLLVLCYDRGVKPADLWRELARRR